MEVKMLKNKKGAKPWYWMSIDKFFVIDNCTPSDVKTYLTLNPCLIHKIKIEVKVASSPASGLSRSESVRAPLWWEAAWGWEPYSWEPYSWEPIKSSFPKPRLWPSLDEGVPCNNSMVDVANVMMVMMLKMITIMKIINSMIKMIKTINHLEDGVEPWVWFFQPWSKLLFPL